ncbi:hypothetical protein PMIN06_008607 [Paraphaeosphaeria minitans]|uniref:Microbial-type PARG catalytic domain-containing protein n=1 Tax=Paraphaeosphaeria minitans TaxID=565426 RepID=A0A9P6GIU9_9PLEO|nr:hypothetical protein PMIN01_04231 [Paraphaeosphaeria minitans]
MGRTEKSQGLAPPAIRKDVRAKQARHIVNKVIPGILASNARARKGVEGSELVVDPGPGYVRAQREREREREKEKEKEQGGTKKHDAAVDEANRVKRKGQGRRRVRVDVAPADQMSSAQTPADKAPTPAPTHAPQQAPPKIRIVVTDTLTAASTLVPPHRHAHTRTRTRTRTPQNPCILNMASPLRPGGGLLTGATSQEEFLCSRTTLLPSLNDTFYRLPPRGAIFTRDVLVFRDRRGLDDSRGALAVGERFYVDVVSAGMLRFPDLEGGVGGAGGMRWGERDRGVVRAKMRAVMRVAVGKGAGRLVLGAWGCGAYGNPVVDVAEAWRAVLLPCSCAVGSRGRGKVEEEVEVWEGLEEVVFAISSETMAREFAGAFGGVEVEQAPRILVREDDEGVDEVAEELRAKIAEMEGQVEKVWNAELKQRMSVILEGLRAQLREREGERPDSDHEERSSEAGGLGLSDDEVDVEHYSSDG